MITNTQNFYLTTIDGEKIAIHCETYEHRSGWGHRASIYRIGDNYINFSKRITYYNRTWESFKYESVLRKVLREYYNTKAESNALNFILMQLDAIADRKAEEARKWVQAFTEKYNVLSEETKATLRKKDIIFNTVEQAETVINTALMFDAI